jgi:hypothetical protein
MDRLSLLQFIGAVFSQWVALMTGGLIAFGLALWERWYGRISWGRYIAVLVVTVFVACYLTWFDEHQKRVSIECRLSVYQSAQNARRSFVQTELQKFYSDAQTLLHKRITPDEFPRWANDDRSKLSDMNGNAYDFAGFAVSPVHEAALNWLNKASQNLATLIKEPIWIPSRRSSQMNVTEPVVYYNWESGK